MTHRKCYCEKNGLKLYVNLALVKIYDKMKRQMKHSDSAPILATLSNMQTVKVPGSSFGWPMRAIRKFEREEVR
jgi:hypothetical protein